MKFDDIVNVTLVYKSTFKNVLSIVKCISIGANDSTTKCLFYLFLLTFGIQFSLVIGKTSCLLVKCNV